VGFRVTDSNSVGSSEGVTFAEIYFTFTISEAINILSVNEGHVETGREEVVQLFVSPTSVFEAFGFHPKPTSRKAPTS